MQATQWTGRRAQPKMTERKRLGPTMYVIEFITFGALSLRLHGLDRLPGSRGRGLHYLHEDLFIFLVKQLHSTEGGSCYCARGLLQLQREPRPASGEVRGFRLRPSKLRKADPAGSVEVARSASGEAPRPTAWRP